MSQNDPGSGASHQGDPNNLSTNPQQPVQQPGSMRQSRLLSPQPRRKSSERSEVIKWAIAATLLILICVGASVAIYIGVQKGKDIVHSNVAALAVSAKVRAFCQSYETRNYDAAYQLLSKAAQGRASPTWFTSHQTAVDASAGNVMSCTMDSDHSLPSLSSDGKIATAWIQVVRGANAKPATGTITLVYEDSAWTIDRADSSLTLL
ncbi:MAG TPA: hypothetical protein VH591_13330 [Ktedonobacterales bacterium]